LVFDRLRTLLGGIPVAQTNLLVVCGYFGGAQTGFLSLQLSIWCAAGDRGQPPLTRCKPWFSLVR
jgi:hypothetical protein